jgi:hypothetical protein
MVWILLSVKFKCRVCAEVGEGDRTKQEAKRGEASAEKDKSSLATYQVSSFPSKFGMIDLLHLKLDLTD